MERGSAGAADKVNVPVDELQRALSLRVVENAGIENCFALAVADATDGRVAPGTVRPQARLYINASPRAPVVSALTRQERRDIDRDREYISDKLAHV